MTFPCLDCQRREVGCHAKCDEYKAARAEADKELDARREEIKSSAYYKATISKNINKKIKRKLRQ